MGEELFGNKEFLPHKLLIQFIPEIAPGAGHAALGGHHGHADVGGPGIDHEIGAGHFLAGRVCRWRGDLLPV